MPRPQKPGLEYWSLDVDWQRYPTILAAQSLVDPEGLDMRMRYLVASFFRDIVNEAFRDKGYYLPWDKNAVFALSSAYSLPVIYINRFIEVYMQVGLLDEQMYLQHNILTSCGLQLFWMEVQKSAKKNNVIEKVFHITNGKEIDYVSLPADLCPFREGKLPFRGSLVHKYIFFLFSYNNTISNSTNKENKEKEIIDKESLPTEKTTLPTPKESLPTEKTTLPTPKESLPTEKTTLEDSYEYKVEQYRIMKGIPMNLAFCKRMFFEHPDFTTVKTTVHGSFPKDGLEEWEVEAWAKAYADRFNDYLASKGEMEKAAGQWSAHFKNWSAKQPKHKEDAKQLEIIFPFDTETFREAWKQWKIYLFTEKNEDYKSVHSEQAALKQLTEISEGKEAIAIATLEHAMSSRWKNFFKLKNNDNGTTGSRPGKKEPTGKDVSISKIFSTIDRSTAKDGGGRS